MKYIHKPPEEPDVLDDFLINAIASDKDVGIPFGYDYMMYTIRNKCEELPDMDYDDGIHFIYFYTGGSKGGCKEIKSMLQYLQKSTVSNVTDDATQLVHDYVSKVKVLPEVKLEYMKFDEIIYYAKKEAAKEAAQEATLATYMENILSLLEDYGDIPVNLRVTLRAQTKPFILKEWHKLAAKATSIEDFNDKIRVSNK